VKHLTISEIALLSEQEKRARRETLDPKRTIVLGGNETGKSSLLKALYFAFGAEPAKQHPRWQKAEIKALVKFAVDGAQYMLLRDSSYFALFSGNGAFLESFTRVTGDLSPYLSKIFDFGLVLASRQEEPETPPPAYLFLPFYMDQDASWLNAWAGFDRLFQFTAWKESLVEYHTGIRDNDYYQVRARQIKNQSRLGELDNEATAVRTVADKLAADKTTATFNLNPDVFSDQVRRLLAETEKLSGHENELKDHLARLNGERLLQKTRLAIANQALGELSGDFKFLTHSGTEEIECPTCGNHYWNDFAVRFSIATDEDRVAEFIAHIKAEIGRLDQEIANVYEKYSVAKEAAARIQAILAEKQGELTLGQVIESEGRKAADRLLNDQLDSIRSQTDAISGDITQIKEEMRALNARSQGTRKDVMEEYERSLRRNFLTLGVNSFVDGVFKTLTPNLLETGSTLPRALLAYQFAILELISKRSPATVCPVVIDSPNQQAQDKDSLTRILTFIAENQPNGTQLILGLENDLGIDFGGKMISTTTKYHLLQENQYASVHEEIFGLLKNSLKS
jgi:hypothetical protein